MTWFTWERTDCMIFPIERLRENKWKKHLECKFLGHEMPLGLERPKNLNERWVFPTKFKSFLVWKWTLFHFDIFSNFFLKISGENFNWNEENTVEMIQWFTLNYAFSRGILASASQTGKEIQYNSKVKVTLVAKSYINSQTWWPGRA